MTKITTTTTTTTTTKMTMPSAVTTLCLYYGKSVCNEEGRCDSEKFDCWSDSEDEKVATTGQCPSDDADAQENLKKYDS